MFGVDMGAGDAVTGVVCVLKGLARHLAALRSLPKELEEFRSYLSCLSGWFDSVMEPAVAKGLPSTCLPILEKLKVELEYTREIVVSRYPGRLEGSALQRANALFRSTMMQAKLQRLRHALHQYTLLLTTALQTSSYSAQQESAVAVKRIASLAQRSHGMTEQALGQIESLEAALHLMQQKSVTREELEAAFARLEQKLGGVHSPARIDADTERQLLEAYGRIESAADEMTRKLGAQMSSVCKVAEIIRTELAEVALDVKEARFGVSEVHQGVQDLALNVRDMHSMGTAKLDLVISCLWKLLDQQGAGGKSIPSSPSICSSDCTALEVDEALASDSSTDSPLIGAVQDVRRCIQASDKPVQLTCPVMCFPFLLHGGLQARSMPECGCIVATCVARAAAADGACKLCGKRFQSDDWENWEFESAFRVAQAVQAAVMREVDDGTAVRVPELLSEDLKIGAYLGGGSQGGVHHGVWQGRTVAVKLLKFTQDERKKLSGMMTQLSIEYEASQKIEFMCTLFGVVWTLDCAHVLMELCKENLRDCVAKRGRGGADLHDTLRIGCQVAKALTALHEDFQLLHLDVTPANIFMTEDGDVRLGDFGKSQVIQLDCTSVATDATTPKYSAPEVKKRRGRPASDVYSLAAVLLFMCTGRDPFPRAVDEDDVKQQQEAGPLQLPADMHPQLRNLLAAMSQPEPKARPRMSQVAAALEALLNQVRAKEVRATEALTAAAGCA